MFAIFKVPFVWYWWFCIFHVWCVNINIATERFYLQILNTQNSGFLNMSPIMQYTLWFPVLHWPLSLEIKGTVYSDMFYCMLSCVTLWCHNTNTNILSVECHNELMCTQVITWLCFVPTLCSFLVDTILIDISEVFNGMLSCRCKR